MNYLCFIILQCYFSFFPKESNEVLQFIEINRKEIEQNLQNLDKEDQKMAMAIVAPEISQFSKVWDFMEMRTLFITYRNFERGDFSVGPFQMKPSFIEQLEVEINNNPFLEDKYHNYIIHEEDKAKRETRLIRLSSLTWQLKYLQVFIDLVKIKTKNIKFKSTYDKLRYWATLYNSGFNLSNDKVLKMQQKKLFPHNLKRFNYSDVVVEFYLKINL